MCNFGNPTGRGEHLQVRVISYVYVRVSLPLMFCACIPLLDSRYAYVLSVAHIMYLSYTVYNIHNEGVLFPT